MEIGWRLQVVRHFVPRTRATLRAEAAFFRRRRVALNLESDTSAIRFN